MANKTSLLVVDDDAAVRALLLEYLGEQGYAVRAAADGAAMRAEIERELPDLVLLDLRLPGEDGLTLARQLRERVDVGIVMVSASGDIVDRVVGNDVVDDHVAPDTPMPADEPRIGLIVPLAVVGQAEPDQRLGA